MNRKSTVQSRYQRKWIYEEIVDRIPPFRWIPRTYDVIAQLLLVETVGVFAFIYFQMPYEAAVFGSLAIIYTVVWSSGCLYIVPWLRRLRDPTNEIEFEVLRDYKSRILLDRRLELIGGIICFGAVMSYLWIDTDYLRYFLGNGFGNPLLIILIIVLAWDISYRLGLSLVTTFFAAIRSISLSQAARKRRGLAYTAYSEVRTLKYLDLINLYWGISAVLLLPLTLRSYFLLLGLAGFLAGIIGLSTLSLLAMETVPWFPPDVESILHNEGFAYVSVCSKKQPHVTPVIFVYDGKYLYFAISVASAKYRIIKKNPKIAVLVDMRDSKFPMKNRAVLLRGKGMILGDLSIMGFFKLFLHGLWLIRVRNMFAKKYPMYMKFYEDQAQELPPAWRNKPFLSRVIVRLEPEKITYWREARPTTLRA
ncbi:MAG: pyridoxamine 5'-phosphate oxidase family protein [Candidatus Thorarchaeota archaeon]|nr:pyridoxamine 5'-phosphate oxidase family protein [Candidatus Thorarchaeota archaeon]